MLNSKNSSLATTKVSQVLLAYKYIDSELRRDLSKPKDISTMLVLLDELRHQKDIWYDIYSKGYKVRLSTTPTSSNRNDNRKRG